MHFTIEITDTAHLAGITAARAARNSNLGTLFDDNGNALPVEQHPDYLATDAAYVQFVMSKAAESYARQYATAGA